MTKTYRFDALAAADPLRFTERLYTVKEAAEKWHISANTLYREIAAGRLRAKLRKGTSKGYIITASIMKQWMDEQLVDAYDVLNGGRYA